MFGSLYFPHETRISGNNDKGCVRKMFINLVIWLGSVSICRLKSLWQRLYSCYKVQQTCDWTPTAIFCSLICTITMLSTSLGWGSVLQFSVWNSVNFSVNPTLHTSLFHAWCFGVGEQEAGTTILPPQPWIPRCGAWTLVSIAALWLNGYMTEFRVKAMGSISNTHQIQKCKKIKEQRV